MSARMRMASGVALLCACAGAALNKLSGVDRLYGILFPWPLSLMAGLAYAIAVDAVSVLFAFLVFLIVSGQLEWKRCLRGFAFCLTALAAGRILYLFASVLIPPHGPVHASPWVFWEHVLLCYMSSSFLMLIALIVAICVTSKAVIRHSSTLA